MKRFLLLFKAAVFQCLGENSDRTIKKEAHYEKPPLSFVEIKLLGLTRRWKFHASILCQVDSCFDMVS